MNPRLARTVLGELTELERDVLAAQKHNLLTAAGHRALAVSLESMTRRIFYLQHLTDGKRDA